MLIAPYAHTEKAFIEYMRKLEKLCPPPIPFSPKKGTYGKDLKDKDDDSEEEEKQYRSFVIKLDLEDDDSDTFKHKVKVFEDGSPEEWCQWRLDTDELFQMMGITGDNDDDAQKRFNIYRSLLKGKTKERWNAAYSERETINQARNVAERISFRAILKLVLNDVTKKIFPKPETDYRTQVKYMKTFLWIGKSTVKEFTSRVERIDRMLPYFPRYGNDRIPRRLEDDELIELLDNAKRPEWGIKMAENEKVAYAFESYEKMKEYFTQLETAQEIRNALNEARSSGKKRSRDDHEDHGKKKGKSKFLKTKKTVRENKTTCEHCGNNHPSKDCWTLPQNANKRPKWYKKSNEKIEPISKEAIFALVRAYEAQQQEKRQSTFKNKGKEKNRGKIAENSDKNENPQDAFLMALKNDDELNSSVEKLSLSDEEDSD